MYQIMLSDTVGFPRQRFSTLYYILDLVKIEINPLAILHRARSEAPMKMAIAPQNARGAYALGSFLLQTMKSSKSRTRTTILSKSTPIQCLNLPHRRALSKRLDQILITLKFSKISDLDPRKLGEFLFQSPSSFWKSHCRAQEERPIPDTILPA